MVEALFDVQRGKAEDLLREKALLGQEHADELPSELLLVQEEVELPLRQEEHLRRGQRTGADREPVLLEEDDLAENLPRPQALEWMRDAGIGVPDGFSREAEVRGAASSKAREPLHSSVPRSALTNWPIQMHLLSPMAPRFKGADVLLSADCVAYAAGSFHSSMLDGKALAIACPKLDEGRDIYREKLTALIDHAQIASLTVVMMQVPCCRGLLDVARQARERAHRTIPLKVMIVSIDDGTVLSEQAV